MNNISNNLINQIKHEIKDDIRNSIYIKIDSLIEQEYTIFNVIKFILNQINTNELPEEMETLINNYSLLVDNQNNRYNFKVGENPFNILNILINDELKLPLLLIYDKYNSIEEELLNKIEALAISSRILDCYSEIKNNLLGNKIGIIDYLTDQINTTMLEYKIELVNDIDSYVNKLIHFSYIDGLKTMKKSC